MNTGEEQRTVGILGAGTMGSGIAQVAAVSGWHVTLMDVGLDRAERAIAGIARNLERLVEKGRLTPAAGEDALRRIRPAAAPAELAGCGLILEAVVEDLAAKVAALRPIVEAAPADALVASNTSSLSITQIGRGLGVGPRTVGMHFFNPVPLMPLVEVVAGRESGAEFVERAWRIAAQWGKTPVRVRDTPGFIVNRVARGYYLESLRILDEGLAAVDEIDRTLRELGGFRMGPFELMDLIGIDVNYAVTCSVWEQMGRPARLKPHPLQRDLAERGRLGRKSGRGFYAHHCEPPVPDVRTERRPFDPPAKLVEQVRRFCDRAAVRAGSLTEQYVFARVLVTIINEAALALDEGIASQADIDTAMRLGTSYPRGPLEWAGQIGRYTCATLLRTLDELSPEPRFTPAGWLTT